MTSSPRIIHGVALALLLVSLAVTVRADETGQPVPRYRLQVGQELNYQGTSEFKYEGGAHGYKTDWRVWVLRQNEDGSWRIMLRSSQKFSQSFDGRARSEQPARVTMAYCDLFPDGRIVPNDSLGFHLDPTAILPRLPQDERQARQGWNGGSVRDDSRTAYTREGSENSDTYVFIGVRQSAMDKIYLSSSRAKYSFDQTRGVIGRIESENTQGYGFNGKGSGTTELAAVEQHDAEWTRTFANESNRYFAANHAYQELLTKASKNAEHADALLAEAETTLKEARGKLSVPVLRERVDEQLTGHQRMSSYYAQEAKNRSEVLGHAAADWETKDLEGKPHALKDYRGKVVILDFWYRGCGWCIRAMPQMIEIANDFRDEPVAVLGMNTDRDEKDAQFVVDAMKLNYPVLRAEGLPEKYHVRGFPTLVIIDQEGKVADIHVGYSPSLREEVSRSIKNLLAIGRGRASTDDCPQDQPAAEPGVAEARALVGALEARLKATEARLTQARQILAQLEGEEKPVPAAPALAPADERPEDESKRLEGVWRIVSIGGNFGDTFEKPPYDEYKIMSAGRYLWLSFDPDTGKVLRSGGGKYTLNGENYTAQVEGSNSSDLRAVVGQEYHGTCRLDGKKWYHFGRMPNGAVFDELWERVH